MNAFFSDDFCLMHFLHCVNSLRFFEFDAPDLSKSSLAYDILAVEVISIDFFAFQDKSFFIFFFGVEFGEIYLEAIFDIFGGFF